MLLSVTEVGNGGPILQDSSWEYHDYDSKDVVSKNRILENDFHFLSQLAKISQSFSSMGKKKEMSSSGGTVSTVSGSSSDAGAVSTGSKNKNNEGGAGSAADLKNNEAVNELLPMEEEEEKFMACCGAVKAIGVEQDDGTVLEGATVLAESLCKSPAEKETPKKDGGERELRDQAPGEDEASKEKNQRNHPNNIILRLCSGTKLGDLS
jgi:hypothetical protein